MKRKCSKCKKSKSLSEFHKNKSDKKYGRTHYCKKCRKSYDKKNKEKIKSWQKKYWTNIEREKQLIRKYGITLQTYNELLIKQDYRCAICDRHQLEFNQRLAVDHDHKTIQIRGLLCHQCNLALGWFDKFEDKILNYKNEKNFIN